MSLRKILESVRGDRAVMRKRIRQLEELNRDLDAQVRELLKAHPITDAERADITRVRQEHINAAAEIAEVVCYVRNNFPQEMEAGAFTGMNMAQMVCKLLNVLKQWCDASEAQRSKGRLFQ